jgi:phosphocarrier protein HPr
MVSKDTRVVDKLGLHMRPANNFIQAMSKYKSNITIVFNGNKINGKSIMNIMAACIKYDSPITVICEGEDEQEMLDEAIRLIEGGLE